MADPSVGRIAELPATSPTIMGPHTSSTGPAATDPVARFGCGPRVAERTWYVQVDDGSISSSLDVTFYLVLRPDVWRVWGSY